MPAPLAGLAIKGATKAASKLAKKALRQKKLTKGQKSVKKATEAQKVTKNYGNVRSTKGAVKGSAATAVVMTAGQGKADKTKTKKPSAFEKAFSAAHNAGKKTFIFKGKSYNTKVKKGK